MVGIAKDYSRPQRLEILLGQGLHRSLSTNRHEYWTFDLPLRRVQQSGPSSGLRIGRYDLEFQCRSLTALTGKRARIENPAVPVSAVRTPRRSEFVGGHGRLLSPDHFLLPALPAPRDFLPRTLPPQEHR